MKKILIIYRNYIICFCKTYLNPKKYAINFFLYQDFSEKPKNHVF